MFGSTTSDLFGKSTPQSSKNTGSLFGTGNLFGSTGIGSNTTLSGASRPLENATADATSIAATGGVSPFGAALSQSNGMSAPQQGLPFAGGLFGGPSPSATTIPTSGLFGNATEGTATPSTGIFSASVTQQPTTTGLFNAVHPNPQPSLFSDAKQQVYPPVSTGLFGSSNNATTTTPSTTGLFSNLNPQQQTLNQPSNSLFGTLSTQQPGKTAEISSGDFFSKSTPSTGEAPGTVKPIGIFGGATTPVGLFGSSTTTTTSDPTGKATTGGLFGSSEPKSPGGLFGSTDFKPPVVGIEQSSITETQKASSSGLFGAKPPDSSTTLGTAIRPSGSLTGLGPIESSKPGSIPSLLGEKKDDASGGLIGEPGSNSTSPNPFNSKDPTKSESSYLPAFGASTTKTHKPSLPSVETVKSTALEASQYEKVDDVMKNWDRRLKQQVSDFRRYAEAVMRLDLDLFKTVSELENVQQQQSLIETKQQEIDMSLDQMENHQVSLAKMLQQMEMLLTAQLSGESIHPLQGAMHSLTANIDDSESLLDQLTLDINKIRENLYPGALGKIIDLVNIQHRSLERLSNNCQQLRDKIVAIERA